MSLLFTTHTGQVKEVKEPDYFSPVTAIAPSTAAVSPVLPSPPIFTPLTMESIFTPLATPPLNPFPLSTPLNSPPIHQETKRASSPRPIITVTNADHLPALPNMAGHGSPPVVPETVQKVRSVSRKKSGKYTVVAGEENPALWMVYNEYGELVTLEQKSKPLVAEELTITQALRLVYKTYHAEVSHL